MNSAERNFSITELQDSAIPGIAAQYEELTRQKRSEDQILNTLAGQGIFAPPNIRGPAWQWIKDAIEAMKGRTLVKDLGNFTAPLTWLTLDIPYQSRASLEWKTEASRGGEFSLRLLGSGFGGGRSISWSVTQAIQERDSRVVFMRDVITNVKLYKIRDANAQESMQVETSVVGRGPVRLVSEKNPTATSIDELDPSLYDIDYGKALDLTAYDVPFSQTDTYSIDKSLSLTIGVAEGVLPAGLSAEINAELGSHGSCEVVWQFAPRFIHQPYWKKRGNSLLPLWGIRRAVR